MTSRLCPGNCKAKKLLLPKRSPTNHEVIRYLSARGIDREIISQCIREGLLYESLPYHNCVFVGYDRFGNARYASYRAANAQRIMGEAAGSDKCCGFRIGSKGRTVHVFESAIDLLSFATIMKEKTGGWRKETMLSLGGVYAPAENHRPSKLPAALTNLLNDQPEIDTIALHLDNDYAGRHAATAIKEQLHAHYRIRDEPPPKGKDVKDYLQMKEKGPRVRSDESSAR